MTARERAALAEAREAEAQRRKRAQSTASPKATPAVRQRTGENTREYAKANQNVKKTAGKPPITQPQTEKVDTGEFPSYVRRGKGGYHPPKPKSRKVPRHRRKLNPKLFAAICAVGAILLIIVILLASGVRYKSVPLEDGGEITFFGISKGGEATSGWLSYSDGVRGRLSGGEKIKYSDGSIYEGEIKDGVRDGSGILTYASGDVYEGEFDDDEISGYGKLTYANGDIYEGQFKNGLRDGRGSLLYSDKTSFEGEFKEGRKNGYGVYTGNGTSYEGNYVDDIKEGKGKHVFGNGDTYEGEYKNDMRNGYGVYTWADGGYYEGEFKDNIQQGMGKRVFASGITQEGRFENGLFVG